MAEVVLGFASSHAPQLRMRAESWPLMIQKDANDPRFDYEEVLGRAKPDMDKELTPEIMQQRDEANQASIGALRKKLADVSPDAIVVIGDDQHEQFQDSNMPMFSIYYGSSIVTRARRGRPMADKKLAAAWGNSNNTWQQTQEVRREDAEHESAPDFAKHIISSLRYADFDIGASDALNEEIGIGHAFGYLYDYLMPEKEVPVVPVSLNTFFPPNQPTPKRAYQLGEAIRKSVDSWDGHERVAIMASGGLSHFIIDEEIDQMTLDALQHKDAEALKSLPEDQLLILGTTEILNWVTLGGAIQDKEMHLVDYVPCYRTPAGTGCAMGFAYWE